MVFALALIFRENTLRRPVLVIKTFSVSAFCLLIVSRVAARRLAFYAAVGAALVIERFKAQARRDGNAHGPVLAHKFIETIARPVEVGDEIRRARPAAAVFETLVAILPVMLDRREVNIFREACSLALPLENDVFAF